MTPLTVVKHLQVSKQATANQIGSGLLGAPLLAVPVDVRDMIAPF